MKFNKDVLLTSVELLISLQRQCTLLQTIDFKPVQSVEVNEQMKYIIMISHQISSAGL